MSVSQTVLCSNWVRHTYTWTEVLLRRRRICGLFLASKDVRSAWKPAKRPCWSMSGCIATGRCREQRLLRKAFFCRRPWAICSICSRFPADLVAPNLRKVADILESAPFLRTNSRRPLIAGGMVTGLKPWDDALAPSLSSVQRLILSDVKRALAWGSDLECKVVACICR
jgi:hypothetical protein